MCKRIGILSGLGAAAGVRFLDMLVKECQNRGASKDSDFPEIVLFNMSSEGMDETGIIKPDIMKEDMLNGISFLDNCQVEVILIACNSVYVYYDYLQDHSFAKIINMPKVAMKFCGENYGVLCSRSTEKAHFCSVWREIKQ